MQNVNIFPLTCSKELSLLRKSLLIIAEHSFVVSFVVGTVPQAKSCTDLVGEST